MSEGACEFLSGFVGGRQNKNWHPGYVLQTHCRKTGGIAMKMQAFRAGGMLTSMAGSLLFAFGALADPLGFAVPVRYPAIIFQQVLPDRGEDDRIESAAEVPAHLRRQVVEDPTREARGTVVIDTANTYLYLVLGAGKAVRYGIGVGREGFTWAGVRAIERKAEWPDWLPPSEMINRQ